VIGFVWEVMDKNPSYGSQSRGGKGKMVEYPLGQVVRGIVGRASPKVAREVLERELQERSILF
jgi:Asp-tRNA(Asn)/Glu-tRNA(Gln) amidotransferase B subunit